MEDNKKKRHYYTVKEIRTLIYDDQISITTLHKLMNSGRIPFIELCRKRLIPAVWADKELERARMGLGQEVTLHG